MTDKVKIRAEHNAAGLTNVAKVVMPIAKQLLGSRGYLLTDLIGQWQMIVGKEIARCALPVKLAFAKNSQGKGTLTVAACSGAAAVEIKQRQNILLGKINMFLGSEIVSAIKVIQTANPADFKIDKKPIEILQRLGHDIEDESKGQGEK